MTNVGVLSVGFGNPACVINMFSSIGCNAFSIDKTKMGGEESVDLLVLPGVGSFDGAMEGLGGTAKDYIREYAQSKKPLLGICIGMQILFDSSEEGVREGLSLIAGRVKRFPQAISDIDRLPIPHVGWNKVALSDEFSVDSELLARFYFTHSYMACPEFAKNVVCKSFYGIEFCAMVKKDNVFGVQFHPEKSNIAGKNFLKNFLTAFCE